MPGESSENVPLVVCCSRTHVHRFANAVVTRRGRPQGEIAFLVRALMRLDSGAFLHDVVSDAVEN